MHAFAFTPTDKDWKNNMAALGSLTDEPAYQGTVTVYLTDGRYSRGDTVYLMESKSYPAHIRLNTQHGQRRFQLADVRMVTATISFKHN